MVTGASHGRNLPRSLLKIRIGPHSQASINSDFPSPSRSLNTAPLTKPTFSNRCASTSRPPSFFNNNESAGSGYRPAPTAPNHQILPPVTVHVIPRHARPQLAQLLGQQGLPLKIVELLLVVGVTNQVTDVLK